jgi:uncharacterized protein (TIGR01777 family)
MAHYILTGGTGLIGKNTGNLLQKKGYTTCLLSRQENLTATVPAYEWDITRQTIDTRCFEQATGIIHLAGAGISAKRWTQAYKEELYTSRILSTRLLYETLKNTPNTVQTIIATSGIGIYGDTGNELIQESHTAGNTFLAHLCKNWEAEVLKIASLGIRVVILRTGIVLSSDGGFIKEMSSPIKWGLGAPLGNGKQAISWIHINDLSQIIVQALEDPSMQGIYHAVAPHPCSNGQIIRKMAKHLHRLILMPGIPAVLLNIVLGEITTELISGQRASSRKIENTGFVFEFPDIDSALADVLPQ